MSVTNKMKMNKPIGYVYAGRNTSELVFVNNSGHATTFTLGKTFKKHLCEPAYFVGNSNDDLILIYGDENNPDCITTNEFLNHLDFLKQLYALLGFNGEHIGKKPSSTVFNEP